MAEVQRTAGRPGRFAEYERFEAGLPKPMKNRPAYHHGIGVFKGATDTTVWVKVRFPRGGEYKGRSIAVGGAVEHKLGRRASWTWPDLVKERDRLQGLADRGEPLEAVEIRTFAAYAKDWLDRKKPTLRGYGVTKSHITSALNPTFGKKALNTITVADVNRWIGRQSENLKPATVKRQLATFDAIMNDAVRCEIINRNPSELTDSIKGIEPRQRIVTDREWKHILDTAGKIEREQEANKERKPHQIRGWLRHYIVWAYESGMRRGEILNLTWDRVRSLDDTTIIIEVAKTKTGKPRRINCTSEMMAILSALGQLDRSEGDNRVFPVSMTTVKRSLKALWKSTGLPDIRLHDLRRTHASILIGLGIDPRTVADRMGHSLIMLSEVYAVGNGDREAVRAFDALVRRGDVPVIEVSKDAEIVARLE